MTLSNSLRRSYAPPSAGKDASCTCKVCVEACEHKPGWFLPDEIKILAERMGLSFQDLFNQHLGVDWYETKKGKIYVLAPRVEDQAGGQKFTEHGLGRCAFLTNDRCSIHELGKPFECAAMSCQVPPPKGLHRKVAAAWDTPEYQGMVQDLLAGVYVEIV